MSGQRGVDGGMADGMVPQHAVGELDHQDRGRIAGSPAQGDFTVHHAVHRKRRPDPQESQYRREPHLLRGSMPVQHRIVAQQRVACQLEHPAIVKECQRGQHQPPALIVRGALNTVDRLPVEADRRG